MTCGRLIITISSFNVLRLYLLILKRGFLSVFQNFGSKADAIFCGVFDGHGPLGHLVAKKVRDSLPLKLSSQWELICSSKNGFVGGNHGALGSGLKNGEIASTLALANGDGQTEILSILKNSFLKAFKVMDKELKLHPHIDCYCSGTTAVTLVKQVLCYISQLDLFLISDYNCRYALMFVLFLQGQDLVIANIGDSRAVLGTRDEDNSFIAVQLTVDLKPSVPSISLCLCLCLSLSLPHFSLFPSLPKSFP